MECDTSSAAPLRAKGPRVGRPFDSLSRKAPPTSRAGADSPIQPEKQFSVGPLAAFIDQGHIEMTSILGFDPLDIEDLKKLGLDPASALTGR